MLVRPKPGILDPQGRRSRPRFGSWGSPSPMHGSVAWSTSTWTRPIGQARDAVERMCQQLLANP